VLRAEAGTAELVRRFPNLSGKIFVLSMLANGGERRPDIADPHGASPETYLACFRRIDELVGQVALRLLPELLPPSESCAMRGSVNPRNG
jgi:protein-tyrosine-phosphatase